MELLIHLWGDFMLQNHYMATHKKTNNLVCLLHVLLYVLPFFLYLTHSITALFVIGVSHYIIDRYSLATLFIKLKNWEWTTSGGFSEDTPAFLSVWLTIFVDNIMHLTINHLALK